MVQLLPLFSLVLLVPSFPGALAGPACSRQHFKQAGCLQKCKSKWGWSGMTMGSNPWGNVIQKSDTKDSWDITLSRACGTVTPAQEPTEPVANVQTGPVTLSSTPTVLSQPTGKSAGFASTSLTAKTFTVSTASTHFETTSQPPKVTSTVISATTISPTHSPVIQTPATSKPAPITTKAPQPTQSTPSPPLQGNSGTPNSDIEAYISSHNVVRAAHGASALTWSDELATKAQQWANKCVFQHSGGSLGPFGENLAAGNGPDFSIQSAVKAWTNEASSYNPADPQASHFTQVVWKATTHVGCAVQLCNGISGLAGESRYYVCEYSVAGNVIGQFAENVQV